MSTRVKGRAAPAGPARLAVPSGPIVLGDGRILRDQGLHELSQKGAVPVTVRSWRGGDGLAVLASSDVTPRWGALLHVSLSYADHDPTWEDIKLVRGVFFPADGDAMIMLPRQSDYINVHAHCFHLWQTPERWGIQ
jgi:hypothetical protein